MSETPDMPDLNDDATEPDPVDPLLEGAPDPGAETSLEDEIVALTSELAAMRDKALRAVAEAENVRRRADKERADTLKYAPASLAKELLPGIDNLRRAVDSVPRDKVDEDETLKGVLVGVEMTEKMLLDAFGKLGIERIDPVDQKFDHASHQAIQKVPDTGKPAGTVVQVLQPGYKLHDRLLRAATVIVAEGDPDTPLDGSEAVDTTA